MNPNKPFRNFEEFYPFYLGEHSNRECRRLHFIGTTASLILIAGAFATQSWMLIGLAFALGYGFAWMGHFFFERNRPATFKYPWYSFLGDWRLWRDIVTGKTRF